MLSNRIKAIVCVTMMLLVIPAVAVPAPAAAAGSDAVDVTGLKAAITTFNGDMTDYVEALTAMQAANVELVGLLTDDYAITTNEPYSISDTDDQAFAQRFAELYPTYLDASLAGFQLMESWSAISDSIGTSGTRAQGTRAFFVAAAFVAGLGMLAYSGYKAVKNAFNKNADASKGIIDAANPADLVKINQELGLPPGNSAAETKAHLDSLSLNQKNTAARTIQSLDMTGEIETGKGAEVKQAHANIANDLGREGTKIYAGAITTVTGGQGIDKLAKAAGLTTEAAAAVDMTLTLTENQPLDVVGRNVEAAVVSKNKQSVTVDQPVTHIDRDTAKTIIQDAKAGTVTQQQLEDAGDSLASDLASEFSDDLGTYENWDGDMVVQTPSAVHVQSVDEVVTGEPIEVPDIGWSDLLLTSPTSAPDITQDIYLYEEEEITVEMLDLDSIDQASVPIDVVFCIDVTGSMSDDIASVVASAQSMLLQLSLRTDDYRMGFVLFRDIDYDTPAFQRYAFSSDYDTIMANIATLPGQVSGGGDTPESVYEGLALANGMPFRADAEHSVILMGDAPGKSSSGTRAGPSYDNVTDTEVEELRSGYTLDSIISALKGNHVKVYSVLISADGYGYDSTLVEEFGRLANATGGSYFTADNAAQVPGVLTSALTTAIDDAVDGDNGSDALGLGCCGLIFLPFAILLTVVGVVGKRRTSARQRARRQAAQDDTD